MLLFAKLSLEVFARILNCVQSSLTRRVVGYDEMVTVKTGRSFLITQILSSSSFDWCLLLYDDTIILQEQVFILADEQLLKFAEIDCN